MSGYTGSCPSCGGEIVFQLGHSLLKVCEHCGSAIARKGADLTSYGKVASLIPTTSQLKLGVRGDYAGAPPFELIGHLQLEWSGGAWDEWLMGFTNGSSAWLSESQGKLHYLAEVALPLVPRFDALTAGQTLDLGPPGIFVVTEVREARFATAEGELPFDVEPGRMLRYADLSGPRGQFGTLDLGTGDEAEALYVGREVRFDELGFAGLPGAEEQRVKVGTQSLSCTQCGGPLELRAPDQTQRVACPYCGSLLDATKNLAVLAVLGKPPVEPLISLGSAGTLRGVEWLVIGFLERSVTIEGVRYPWHEYLLYEPRTGFRWLVESSGHWSFVEPVNPGDVSERVSGVFYDDQRFDHFQSAIAKLDYVVGEFYWALKVGDTVEARDYIAPPRMLSEEIDYGGAGEAEPAPARPAGRKRRAQALAEGSEITWSLGTYLEPEEVWQAFKLPGRDPGRVGVGAAQPSPWAEKRRGLWGWALLAAASIGLLYLVTLVAGGRQLYEQSFTLATAAQPGSPEAAVFVGPLEVPSHANLALDVRADVDNSWLYVDGALINDETGALDEFDAEVSYYHGTDSDGAWTEGGRIAHAYVADVPAGRYTLRLAPSWELGKQPAGYEVTVRSRVPRLYQLILAWLALLAYPVWVSWRHYRFEFRRWAESDHPWGESE